MLGLDYIAKIEGAIAHVHGQASVLAQAAEAVVDSATSKGRLFIHDSAGMISFSSRSYVEGDQVFLKQISERGATIVAVFPVSLPTGGKVSIADYSDLV